MLSRLSGFSGPLSKFFSTLKGFTFGGLILRYEISNTTSYSGTSSIVNDLIGNSNATLTNGPTYSINGYLNFDGSNDYLITNTSLNSKLSPPNTSTVISYFMWVYPTDNGVILSEQGTSSLNSNWYDSQVEMVSGVMKFRIYNGPTVTSSISTPLYNWYYVGLSYDGSVVRTYVNGQFAGSTSVSRLTPWIDGSNAGLYYALAGACPTSLGDGTYAKMKFGAFHVYNTALSQQQVTNNYNATKSDYIYTNNLLIWVDANDPESFTGGKIYDMSGNYFTHSLGSGATSSNLSGIKSFDCNSTSNGFIRVDGIGPTLSSSGYTYVSWARISPTSSNWRTLYRSHPNDHALLVEIGKDNLGFYNNDSNSFIDSGYDITSIVNKWTQYTVVGDSSSSIFYINDTIVGSVSYGASGNRHDYFGGISGQPFGFIGNMMLYNSKLTQAQIKQNYDALKHVYQISHVTDNLRLYFNPAESSSYSGSGTTINDISGNGLTGSMSNITYTSPYFSYNGSSSQISVSDNALLEPGSGNWTMEVWVNQSASGNDVILGKFRNGGGSIDVSYSIRTTGTLVYSQIGNGLGSTLNVNYANSSNYTMSLNTWYQIVYVYSNTSDLLTTYINGASVSSASCTIGNLLNSSTNLYIGSYNGGEFSQWFQGKIGIVRLYSSALSSSDVSKNFEANRNIYNI